MLVVKVQVFEGNGEVWLVVGAGSGCGEKCDSMDQSDKNSLFYRITL